MKTCFLFQVGKGRDVGLNQIALFEGKVAGGNGEQVLSRDIYRLGQLFDFFRMLSFFITTVGFYVCTMVLYPFLFCAPPPLSSIRTCGIGGPVSWIFYDKDCLIAADSAYSIYFLIRTGLPGNLAYFKLVFSFYLFLFCLLFFSLVDSLYVLATLFRLYEMLVVDH